MALAEAEDRKQIPDGMEVPQEIARCQERLATLDEARRKLEEPAREWDAQAQVEYEAKMAKRQAKPDRLLEDRRTAVPRCAPRLRRRPSLLLRG